VIPTVLFLGCVAGLLPRGWIFIPMAAIGWPVLLLVTGVDTGLSALLAGSLLAIVNACLGVLVGAGARFLAGRLRPQT
jgi:hypothetical protein